jgi:hypothetical protein
MSDQRPTPETDSRKAHRNASGYNIDLADILYMRQLEQERDEAREALRDMLSGWRYIRQVHGDLYGVGWDRSQTKAEKALEGAK